jgi:hypothetical protein
MEIHLDGLEIKSRLCRAVGCTEKRAKTTTDRAFMYRRFAEMASHARYAPLQAWSSPSDFPFRKS